jgi:hypothetical protein
MASSPYTLTAAQVALLSHLPCFCACRLLFLARLASRLTESLGKVTHRGSLHMCPRPCT